MRAFPLTAMMLLLMCVPANAGDFYMISRQADGTFVSSHRVFQRAGDTLHPITLCGRDYYARAATVAWISHEATEGRDVGLEYNQGRGWLRVCENPQDQVTLADLGISGEDYVIMNASDLAINRKLRFSKIREAFAGSKNSGEKTSSFHSD